MTHLIHVDPLGFDTAAAAADALQGAFEAIATELFAPRAHDAAVGGFEAQRLRLAPRKILITAHSHPEKKVLVAAKQWDRFELEMGLRQAEVLILALRTPILAAATNVTINPTEQAGADAAGDGPEGPWVLEVFGGGDVSNNRKLEKNATALLAFGDERQKLFACRRSALGGHRPKRAGEASLAVVHDEGTEENGVVMFRITRGPARGRPSSRDEA